MRSRSLLAMAVLAVLSGPRAISSPLAPSFAPCVTWKPRVPAPPCPEPVVPTPSRALQQQAAARLRGPARHNRRSVR